MTNSGAGIAPHQMKLQTCRSQKIKPHVHSSYLSSREFIPTEGFRAEINKRCSNYTFVRMGRLAHTFLTDIILLQYRNLLYELLGTLPLEEGGVAKHSPSRDTFDKIC